MQNVIKNIKQTFKRVVVFFKTLKVVYTWKSVVMTIFILWFMKDDLQWLFFGKEIKLNFVQEYLMGICINIVNTQSYYVKVFLGTLFYLVLIFLFFNNFFIFYIKKQFNRFGFKTTYFNKSVTSFKKNSLDLLKTFFKNI